MDKKTYEEPMMDISLFGAVNIASAGSSGDIILPDHEW